MAAQRIRFLADVRKKLHLKFEPYGYEGVVEDICVGFKNLFNGELTYLKVAFDAFIYTLPTGGIMRSILRTGKIMI